MPFRVLGAMHPAANGPEVVGAVRAFRKIALSWLTSAQHVIDMCGTGGSARNSSTSSTCGRCIVAAAGLPVINELRATASERQRKADVLSPRYSNTPASQIRAL